MPVNGFTIGKDYTLVINTPSGVKRFSLVTNFSAKPVTTDAKVKGLDGVTRNLVFHDGWQGQFDIERQNNLLDNYWAELEEAFHAGVSLQAGTIVETIREVDGSISQYRYTGVVLKVEDLGDKAGDKTVKQKLGFLASRRLKA